MGTIHMVTFKQLLEMINLGKQPKTIKFRLDEYDWDGNSYIRKDGMKLEELVCSLMSMRGLVRNTFFVYEEPTLDDREKRFVKEALVPMRVEKIRKILCTGSTHESIEYDSEGVHRFLPAFKSGAMYKGMKRGRWYTIEELLK